MKHITIAVPTRNRLQKLRRMLNTMPKEVEGIKISIVIICDGDPNTAVEMIKDDRIERVILERNHSGSVFCRNLITQTVEDALIYGVDDIEFLKNSIGIAIKAMRERFPDDDGVVGFNYIGQKQSPTATSLVGQRFLRRYPNRKLFYPGYFHFSCQEIERAAKKLSKFHFEERAEIHHYHPGKFKEESDKTHREARDHMTADRALSSERNATKNIWGISPETSIQSRESLKEKMMSRGGDPHLPDKVIAMMDEKLNKESIVLETGVGSSTTWLAQRVKKLVSFEHNINWYLLVLEELKSKGFKNFEMRFDPLYPKEGISSVNGLFDLIIVDGRGRGKTIKTAYNLLKPGGFLILDNSEMEKWASWINFLDGLGWKRKDVRYRDSAVDKATVWEKPLGERRAND